MELVFLAFMLVGGSAIAIFVLSAFAIAGRADARPESAVSHRDSLAASLLFHVAAAGGIGREEALRRIRRDSGIGGAVTAGIDVGSWADAYARSAAPEQRSALLEAAVRLVASTTGPVPLRQYAALLDLCFGLGFQMDALAKLRQSYGFEFIDHARSRRGESSLYAGRERGRDELLHVLGITGTAGRREISAAYRRLAAQHHPDRFHGASEAEQATAAARFIEITRAYEELLLTLRD